MQVKKIYIESFKNQNEEDVKISDAFFLHEVAFTIGLNFAAGPGTLQFASGLGQGAI